MVRSTLLTASLLAGANTALAAVCGQSQYDPAQYVCWSNQFLCPIKAGEPLSYCAGACYSKFMYTCSSSTSTLSLLPTVPQGTAFRLSASNPSEPLLHGLPVSATSLTLWIGGTTSSYCPVAQVGAACPRGNVTSFVGYEGYLSMNVMVPGGQAAYLSPESRIGYTQAHSAYVPEGSKRTGLAAYQGGGLVNLNGGGWGWAACPSTAPGGSGSYWSLVARNETNAEGLATWGCREVNLKVDVLGTGPSEFGAWQYS
ncbi:carbohydrate binding-domain-containing protein [Podospora aff. communis PSN243]|uniref:Carbohydrate binding-domain-containing protein n=1 Tax=Podospora aff. communis PSN243 TaxID=3040156 RepID=A0AAV9GTE3_9PEZI|nr:carbohydrate binding-domain-containing protein [Podospora aff. communis PSN243]